MIGTIFIGGTIEYNNGGGRVITNFFEYGNYGITTKYPTAKDFIDTVIECHKDNGFKTKIEVIHF